MKINIPWRNVSRTISHCKSASLSNTCKKDLSYPMQQASVVGDVESGWYKWWEENNFFKKRNADTNFIMMLPPPNVTGKLHMGHAVTCALQDALVRWNHMNGRNVLWIPGCDHAGIATQVVVERHLWESKKLTRHDIGREKFLEEVQKWKEDNGEAIYEQMKRMGVMLDWERSYFTLDKKMSSAVVEAFVRLFEMGLIYRGNYMINWCCALQSAISDFEVEVQEIEGPTRIHVPGYEKPITFGYMYDIKYQLVDSDEILRASTTRPESVLGDTALAVNPEDPRYTHVHGKFVHHPFNGTRIPIVADADVLKDFGTGVVKITPASSLQDNQIAQRHNLPVVEIFNDAGCIIGSEEFKDLPRFKARFAVLNALANKGLFDGVKKPHALRLPRCMRSGDVIEHRLKEQWFISTNDMADQAVKAVEEGKLRFHPPEFAKIWAHVLSDPRDWCISRQIWWGHRIPVYWVSSLENSVFGSKEEMEASHSVFVAAASVEEAKEKASSSLGADVSSIRSIEQEKDVLDTWFSSCILPFSIFGWPENTADLDRFFPLSLMETGYDILFFWVFRMVMMSQKLTGKLPFKDVLFHGMVCDAKGQKMSKSKRNVIDPLDIIEGGKKNDSQGSDSKAIEYGADALRYSLCSFDLKKRNLPLNLQQIDTERLFRNKIWQTIRFLMQNIESIPDGARCMEPQLDSVSHIMDQWMMSHLSRLVTEADEGFHSYDVNKAAVAFKNFWHYTLCDVYLEAIKPRLWNHAVAPEDTHECLKVLWTCCHTGLLILAPFMPFLTEELYQRLPAIQTKMESVHQCSYPRPEEWKNFRDVGLEDDMKMVLEAASALRALRKTYNITSKSGQGKASIYIEEESVVKMVSKLIPEITRICFLSEVCVFPHDQFDGSNIGAGLIVHPVLPGVTVQLHLQGMIDPTVEGERFGKKLKKLEDKLEQVRAKIESMQSKNFELKESDLVLVNTLQEEINKINSILEHINRMKS